MMSRLIIREVINCKDCPYYLHHVSKGLELFDEEDTDYHLCDLQDTPVKNDSWEKLFEKCPLPKNTLSDDQIKRSIKGFLKFYDELTEENIEKINRFIEMIN